ncbi:MFS general substrate transporter [Ramaria rubella]|nr:MFS general substrate transporter [Ramaria rubella]
MATVKADDASSCQTHVGSDQRHVETGTSLALTVNEDALDGAANEAQLEKQSPNPYLVVFSPDDPENPKNWGRLRRWILTLACSIFVLNSTFASSSPSGIIQPTIEHFQFSEEVGILTVSLFVAGYCFGPLVWGPLSEQYGRRPIFIIAFIGYTGFQVGDALAPNTAALLIFRFLGGAFAACPLTNSGAFMADVWDAKTRGKAMALFCLAPFAGPALAPTVGGYIAASEVSWRWLYWALAFFAGVCLFVIIFFIPETYEPVILARKARRIRKETGDEHYHAAIEKHWRNMSWFNRVSDILGKPFTMLFHEPMLMAITVYMAFVYGCIYLLFEAYPIVFEVGHHMNAGEAGLMFIPILVGACIAILIYFIFFEPEYARKIKDYAPDAVPPEERLRIALWSGPFYVVAFFWFGWTSFPSVSFWAPMMSGIFVGASIIMIFLSLINYTIDAYLSMSASALAVMTVVRSMAGAGFPLFAIQMYNKLNPRWASTLLGLIALLMMPIPFILLRYGPELRRRSRYAPTK